MKRIFSIFSIVLIGLFAFVACSPQASFSDELVSVSLTGSKGTVRSLIAENDFDIASVKVWKYTAEKADQGLATGASDTQIELVKDSSGNWMTQALSQGAWNFSLFGYSDTDGTVLICSGTAENQTITVTTHNVKITVKPSQTATGTILVKDDIKIVDKNGKEYTGSEYTKTVKVYNSSSEDVTGQISSPVKSGRYKVTVTFTSTVNGEDYTAAKADKYINVYDNLTTTVSGTITETEQAGVVEPEGGMISATSEAFTVTLDDNGKNKEPVKLEVASTPAGTTNNSKTTVEFPAGSIDMGTNTSLTLKVESTSIESASTSYSVETSEGAAVASLNFTLEGAKDNSTFTTEEGVVVTTIITKGLTENPVIKYVGDSTGKDPEFVSYNATTGELKFKVFHFSTYLVLSQNVVAVDGDGNTYSSLKDALTSDAKEITVLKDAEMDENISISNSKAVDLNGKTITIGKESIESEVIVLPSSDSAYKVVFKDGSITAVSGNNIFSVHTNATLVLDNVDLDAASCNAGIFLYNGANPANLEVKDSSLDINGGFGIGTNASNSNETYVNIQIDNSTLTVTSNNDDNTGMMINVPANATISGSTISGERQGLILRGVGADGVKISNSTIESSGTTNNYTDRSSNWDTDNEVALAALVIGNKTATGYQHASTVVLDNVTLKTGESTNRQGMYVWQESENYPVVVTGSINGDYTKNDDTNGATVLPEAKVGDTYYGSFEDAVHAAVKSDTDKTVEVLTDKIKLDNAHCPEINGSVTINANGADFGNGDVSIYTYTTKTTAEDIGSGDVKIVINDARNLCVWGNPDSKRPDNTTISITLNNCENTGKGGTKATGRLVYLTGKNGITNVTLNNCSVKKVESPVYTNAAGTIEMIGCTFTECGTAVNMKFKATEGVRKTIIDGCIFSDCGSEDSSIASYAAPVRIVNESNADSSADTVTVRNCSFTATKGVNGDVLLIDYRAGETYNGLTANFESNKTSIKVRNSAAETDNTVEIATGETKTISISASSAT